MGWSFLAAQQILTTVTTIIDPRDTKTGQLICLIAASASIQFIGKKFS